MSRIIQSKIDEWYTLHPVHSGMPLDELQQGFGLIEIEWFNAVNALRAVMATMTKTDFRKRADQEKRKGYAETVMTHVPAFRRANREWALQAIPLLIHQQWSLLERDTTGIEVDDGTWTMDMWLSEEQQIGTTSHWRNCGSITITVYPLDPEKTYAQALQALQNCFPTSNPTRPFYIWPGFDCGMKIYGMSSLAARLKILHQLKYSKVHISTTPGLDRFGPEEEFGPPPNLSSVCNREDHLCGQEPDSGNRSGRRLPPRQTTRRDEERCRLTRIRRSTRYHILKAAGEDPTGSQYDSDYEP